MLGFFVGSWRLGVGSGEGTDKQLRNGQTEKGKRQTLADRPKQADTKKIIKEKSFRHVLLWVCTKAAESLEGQPARLFSSCFAL